MIALALVAITAFVIAFGAIVAGLWLGREAYQRAMPGVVNPWEAPEPPPLEESYASPDIEKMWPKAEPDE